MIRYFLGIGLVIFIWDCTPTNHCLSAKHYIKNVDTSKPYFIKNKYCIASYADTILRDETSIFSFNVFNRRTGKQIQNGVAWFISGMDTLKLLFDKENAYKKLLPGKYQIDIIGFSDNALESVTEKITLKKNTKMKINFYLGSSMEW